MYFQDDPFWIMVHQWTSRKETLSHFGDFYEKLLQKTKFSVSNTVQFWCIIFYVFFYKTGNIWAIRKLFLINYIFPFYANNFLVCLSVKNNLESHQISSDSNCHPRNSQNSYENKTKEHWERWQKFTFVTRQVFLNSIVIYFWKNVLFGLLMKIHICMGKEFLKLFLINTRNKIIHKLISRQI